MRPSDTSTSVVLSIPDTDPQIAPTEDGLEFREGIRYGSRAGRELMLDLFTHSNGEPKPSPSQPLPLHTALRQAGVSSTRYALAGAGHGDLTFLGDPDGGRAWTSTTMLDIVVEFLSVNLSR
ncbi:MAG TPA: hypothetical protein VGM75_16685 [Pseudonocardiaceae bacterium]